MQEVKKYTIGNDTASSWYSQGIINFLMNKISTYGFVATAATKVSLQKNC